MLILWSDFKQTARLAAICGILVVGAGHASAQTPYDAEARITLADEINRTYGKNVAPTLSITELFDIKNRLDVSDAIYRKYGIQLDYREHSFMELCDIESRIRLTYAINRDYNKNIDWRAYGYNQLLELDAQLSSQSEGSKAEQQRTAQPSPHTG